MSHPKRGDVVKYSAYGRTVNAIVLAAQYGEVSHHGKKGEPLLDLVFIDPDRESAIEKKQIGWFPKVWTEHSVVHQSHEFSVDYKRTKGLGSPSQITAHRGAGEWTEIATEGPEFLAKLRAGAFKDEEAQSEAGKVIEMLGAAKVSEQLKDAITGTIPALFGGLALCGHVIHDGRHYNPDGGLSVDCKYIPTPGEQQGIPVDHPDHLALLESPSGAQVKPGVPDETDYMLGQGVDAEITPEDIAKFNELSAAAFPGAQIPVVPVPVDGAILPEDFTPVAGSSALAGYKYNEAERSFEVITRQGLRYKHENVSPETAQAFELAPSKGVAWNRLIKAPAAALPRESRHNVAVGNDELGDR
jgi:hypothetical protein